MAAPAVPRSWVWHARLRAAALRAGVAWGLVPVLLIGSTTVGAVLAGCGIGLVCLLLFVAVTGPSPTEVAVAGALRTGEVPAELSLALVDTEAAARLRGGRWSRSALVWGCVLAVGGLVLVLLTGATATRLAYWTALSATALASGWALTTSAREAARWQAGADERWAAWAAADRASAG